MQELRIVRQDGRELRVEVSRAVCETDGVRSVTGVFRDVSARRRAEDRFRGLLESAPDAIVIVDRSGEIVLANARAEAIFGYAREELIGRPVEMLLPEQKRRAHAALREGYADQPRPRHGNRPGEFKARRKDGSLFSAEITLNPVETDEGLLVSSAIRDVTDRKRAEEATARLAAIVNSTPNAIVGVGRDGRSRAGTQARNGCTVTRPSRRSASRSRIVDPPERSDSRAHVDAALAGETIRFDSEDIRRDGSRVETSVTISPIRDAAGTITGASCLAQDVSERRRAERAAARLAAIVESSDDAIIGKTLEGTITSWNRGAERIYGYSAAEAIGNHASMLAPADAQTRRRPPAGGCRGRATRLRICRRSDGARTGN